MELLINSLHLSHAVSSIFIVGTTVVILLLLLASIIRLYTPSTPYGLLVLTVWAVAISLFYLLDYTEAGGWRLRSALLLAVFSSVLIDLVRRHGSQIYRAYRSANDFSDLTWLLLCWIGTLFILSIPLLFVFPHDTVISGYFFCNDSVHHAWMAQGFKATRATPMDQWIQFEYETYPRAAHSTIAFLNYFLQEDTARLILPCCLLFTSFMVFPLDALIESKRSRKGFWRALILLCSAAPFLPTSSAYLLFLAQIFCAPLVLAAVITILRFDFKECLGWQFLSILFLSIAALDAYSLISLSIIGVAVIVRIIFFIRVEGIAQLKTSTAHILSPNNLKLRSLPLLLILLAAACSWPLIVSNFQMLRGQFGHARIPDPFLTIKGNLSGHLSPFLLTGVWTEAHDYTYSFEGSAKQYSFLFVLLLELYLIQSKRSWDTTRKTLLCYAPFIFVLAAILPGAYIHFKYLSLFSSVFAFAAVRSAVELGQERQLGAWHAASILLPLAFLYGSVVQPKDAFRPDATLKEDYWQVLTTLDENYLSKGATLILSKDDWFQHFVHGSLDDVLLSQELHRSWDPKPMEKIDYVIYDKVFDFDVRRYLKQKYPKLKQRLESFSKNCVTTYADRFQIFDFGCETSSAKPSSN